MPSAREGDRSSASPTIRAGPARPPFAELQADLDKHGSTRAVLYA